MNERLTVGELAHKSEHIGEYLGIKEYMLTDGMLVAKRIACGPDAKKVRAAIIEHMSKAQDAVRYYFYEPCRLGEDRKGQIVNSDFGESK